MLVVSFAILVFCVLGLAFALIASARRFLRIEDQWRERERRLVDRLLQRASIAPLEVERERILRLPDVEQPQETWIDEAMRANAILEEVEHRNPGALGLSAEQAKAMYPDEWARASRQLAEAQTPLRI